MPLKTLYKIWEKITIYKCFLLDINFEKKTIFIKITFELIGKVKWVSSVLLFFYCAAPLDALKYFQLFFGFLSTVICLRSKNQKYCWNFLQYFELISNLPPKYSQNTINKVKNVRKHKIAFKWNKNNQPFQPFLSWSFRFIL